MRAIVGASIAYLLLVVSLTSPRAATAIDLVQVVSREHPLMAVAASRMSIGRDGNVYLCCGEYADGYVLRIHRDGTGKQGGKVLPRMWMAAANRDGLIATANVHFNHSVNLWSPAFEHVGAVSDFLSSDATEFWDPCDVEAGASGNFFGMDQNRNRIVRIAPPDKTVAAYPLVVAGQGYVKMLPQFRVCEPLGRFYVLSEGVFHVQDFAGRQLWTLAAPISESAFPAIGGAPWLGWHGGFDVDDRGNLYVLADAADVVKVYGPNGKPAAAIHLLMGAHKGRVSDMRLWENDILVKRPDPVELFQVYDRRTGAPRRVVRADVERLRVQLPSDRWTAGEAVPLSIQFESGGRPIHPTWRAWLRPYNTPRFTELPINDGKIVPPADAGGLYQLRVCPGLFGSASDYQVETIVEIRRPQARGSISLWTPLGRIYYGQGEEIPVTVLCRTGEKAPVSRSAEILLVEDGQTVAEQTIEVVSGKPAKIALSKAFTAALRPGRYWLTAVAADLTPAGQMLVVGPGIAHPPLFSTVQYGDYLCAFPAGSQFNAAEAVMRHVARSFKLGTNMFVDRLGENIHGEQGSLMAEVNSGNLAQRLAVDPLAAAPEKARVENPFRQTIAAYGAYGIEERGILVSMDGGLPLGTGYDGRTPEQFAQSIRDVTTTLLAYPAFRGWSWAANWWIMNQGAAAATSPQQKAAYNKAVQRAEQTGKWDPVIDQVSDIRLHYAIDAERQFREVLRSVAPDKLSVMTGPYRAIGVIPPLSFRNADEVDLHYQCEQIQPPQVTPHNVDFCKRPGRRAWGHPELWNDDGTGAMILPSLLQMVMRGADGVGWSGLAPYLDVPSDPRTPGPGTVSVFRELNAMLRRFGPWLTTLESHDLAAIVVSERALRIDDWGAIGGAYFDRLFEAYNACLYAHRPARFLFTEDLQPDTLKQCKAILVVSQRVEPEPPLAALLETARAAGVAVFYDATCREELVKQYRPLGIRFDRLKEDASASQDDSAYDRLPQCFKEHAAALIKALGDCVPPVAKCSEPEVLLTERRSGDARFVWVVNNTMRGLDPGLAWRVGLIMSQRAPVVAKLDFQTHGEAIYDVFAQRRCGTEDGKVEADLRTTPARLYAILPEAIGSIHANAVPREACPAGSAVRVKCEGLTRGGRPVASRLPIWIRLCHEGQVVAERFTTAGSDAAEEFILPVNLAHSRAAAQPGEQSISCEIQVQELISGLCDKATIAVASPQAAAFAPWKIAFPAPDAPPPARDGLSDFAHEGFVFHASVWGRKHDNAPPAPHEDWVGPRLKDIAISSDGSMAAINAMNWDQNVYTLKTKDGSVERRDRIGHHFAYDPSACGNGFAVQGFDLNTPEGYHLYLLGLDGRPERRFALYGLPKRATNWAIASALSDRINNFAAAPNAAWVASAGDLGLAVWSRAGKLLWSQDWWKTTRKRIVLVALDNDTLVTLEGQTATAYRAASGAELWRLVPTKTGALQIAEVSGDHQTLAIASDAEGGRVYVIRNGQLVNTLLTPADAMSLAPDGSALAVTTGNQLKWYATAAGLEWNFAGDDALRSPRIAADGARVAVGSELGSLYVFDRRGRLLHGQEFDGLPVAAWLPGGDLLAATWNGSVVRLGPAPGDASYVERWRVRLATTAVPSPKELLAADATPTAPRSGWGNAAAESAPLTPNLLTDTQALITAVCNPAAGDDPRPWQNPMEMLRDGKPDAPAKPWLKWNEINLIDSGWRSQLAIQLDTFRTQLHVTGITLVEDPRHPESWLRDARLQYWSTEKEQWLDGPYLLSDAATHTHWFDKPIEAARLRLVTTGGGAWPVGNLRLGEIVLHGQALGCSHPDVVARRPVAVLFDENESDLKCMCAPLIFKYDGAYSGGKCLALAGAGLSFPNAQPPFGHVVPNWDFEIVEHPQPGQYRWLQFAWKALSPQTTGITLRLAESHYGGFSFVAGEPTAMEGATIVKQPNAPSLTWQVVRVDLWALQKKPLRIRSLGLGATGGGAAFDQILLGRAESDLPPK